MIWLGEYFGGAFGAALDVIIAISLYTGFSVMVSEVGLYLRELKMPFDLGIITMVALSFVVFLFNLKGFFFY